MNFNHNKKEDLENQHQAKKRNTLLKESIHHKIGASY